MDIEDFEEPLGLAILEFRQFIESLNDLARNGIVRGGVEWPDKE